MKVIIKKTGKVQEVPDGYARNYLLPNGLAILATPQNVSVIATAQQKAQEAESQKNAQWNSWAKTIEASPLRIVVAANADGILFGAVAESAILEALQTQCHVAVQRGWIQIANPIKHVGDHQVIVEFPNKSRATVRVTIVKK